MHLGMRNKGRVCRSESRPEEVLEAFRHTMRPFECETFQISLVTHLGPQAHKGLEDIGDWVVQYG